MGLVANYSYSGLLQQLAPVSNVVLMAVILMWQPLRAFCIRSAAGNVRQKQTSETIMQI